MPRTKIEEDQSPIYLKMNTKLVERIEYEWRDMQYRNRTEYIIDVLSTYMDGVRCPACGAVNPPGGRICSLCMRPLPGNEDLQTKISLEIRNKIGGKNETEKRAEEK